MRIILNMGYALLVPAHPSLRRPRVHVLVCRGCCCGTLRKHPDTDHQGQVAALREAVGTAAVREVDCLGRCDRSNVVVVRRRGAAAAWLGPVLTEAVTAAVADWAAAGAPEPAPPVIAALRFDRHASPEPVPPPTRRSVTLATPPAPPERNP